jgi:hypothetical protein
MYQKYDCAEISEIYDSLGIWTYLLKTSFDVDLNVKNNYGNNTLKYQNANDIGYLIPIGDKEKLLRLYIVLLHLL